MNGVEFAPFVELEEYDLLGHVQHEKVLAHHLKNGSVYTVEDHCPALTKTFCSLYPVGTKFSEHVLVFPYFENDHGVMSTVLATSLTSFSKRRRIIGGGVELHRYYYVKGVLSDHLFMETPVAASYRELFEETGLRGSNFRHVQTDISYNLDTKEVHLKHVLVCFVHDPSTMKTLHTENDKEVLAICTFPIDDVIETVRSRRPLIDKTVDHEYHGCQILEHHGRYLKAIARYFRERM